MATISNPLSGTVTVIPQEICGIICQYAVPSNHLHVLYGISRAFREEAERILYSSVMLRENDKLRSFCITVIRRPHLAKRMRKLVLLLVRLEQMDPNDLSRLVKMLHLSTNLRDLRVHYQDSLLGPSEMHGWILEGHAFKLTTFMNCYFLHPTLDIFLKNQSELKTLIMTWRPILGRPCGMSMSNRSLKILSCSVFIVQELIEASSEMKIESLQIALAQSNPDELWDMEIFFRRLRIQFSETLKRLSILNHGYWWGLPNAGLVACVATHLPNLKFLQFKDYSRLRRCEDPPIFTGFTQMETLLLRPALWVYYEDDQRRYASAWRELQTDAGRLSAATRIMQDVPTLKLLAVEDSLHSICYNYYRNDLVKIQGGLDNDSEWVQIINA